MEDLLVDERFVESIIYGIIVLIIIILLIIFANFFKKMMASRARNITTPFSMTPREMDKLKASGGLTDEELKRVRASMSKQMLERYREDENKKKLAGRAELALTSFEARVQAEGVEKVKQEEFNAPPATPVESRPAKVAAVPPAATTPPLPPNLQSLVGKSDVELEALLAAGFLTAEELAAVRAKASHP